MRRNALAALLLLAACGADWEPAFDATAPPGLFERVTIAPPDEALTQVVKL